MAFLKDAQVASSPLAKKIEFLESKELTPQEIEEALKRANEATETGSPTGASDANSPVISSPMPGYPYPTYAQQPPPLPKRDWKDYFIMATVSVGVTYAIYEVAKRYVLPMIVPPSPQKLEDETTALEEQFKNAQAMLDQLQKDNAELRKNELERTKKVEDMINELESTLSLVQMQVFQGDQDMEIVKQQIEAVKEAIPNDLKEHGDIQAKVLTDLLSDLTALKQMVTSRNQSPPPKHTNPPQIPFASTGTTPISTTPPSITPVPSSSSTPAPAPTPAPSSTTTPPAASGASVAPRAGIPAWQLASGSK